MECQIECHNICQIGMPDRMPDIMSEHVPDRMTKRKQANMSNRLPERLRIVNNDYIIMVKNG